MFLCLSGGAVQTTNCQQSLITSDAEGDGSKTPVASDPQGLLELARVAVLLEEKESAEEGQDCNLPSKSTGEPSRHHQENKRKTIKTDTTGVSSRRRQRNPKRIVTTPERHEACILNQNPADYSVPGPQEKYMIRGEDLKLRKRGKRHAEGDGSKARVASDPQGELQDTARLLELARVAVLLEEKESAEEGQDCNLPSKSTGEPSRHHQENKRKTTATGVSSCRRQRNPKRIVTTPERHEACILNQNPEDYSVPDKTPALV
ncbi:hypothetical protein ACET3Z_004290 [Daucus carota]